MDISYPVRWAFVHRIVTIGSLLLGLVLVAMGFLAGFQGSITTLINNPLSPGPAIEQANPSITVLFSLAGLIVWQFGKSYALFVTLPRAAGRAAGRRFDPKRVSSEVTADLDERLAAMETDIEEIRRHLEEGERDDPDSSDDHTERYDERDHIATNADTGASGAESGDANSSEQAAERQGGATGATVGNSDGTDPLADDTTPSRDGTGRN